MSFSDGLVSLFNYEQKKGNTINTLQQLVFHMQVVDTNGRVMKTIGNSISIMGVIAAPLTGGLSLFATGTGIVINLASTAGENKMLMSLAKTANEELEELNSISEEIQNLPIDWAEVAIQLSQTVINVGTVAVIYKMMSASSKEMFLKLPRELFIKFLVELQIKFAPLIEKIPIAIIRNSVVGACKALTKEVSSEAIEHLNKHVGKKS